MLVATKLKGCYELLSARSYYGRHATGVVLLRNGDPVHHGSRADAYRLIKNVEGLVYGDAS
jgi:hypothetical protein